MSGAQPRRSCTVCAFMVDLLGSQIDARNTRTVSLPPSGRAVLGADLNCSESKAGHCGTHQRIGPSGTTVDRCTAGFHSPQCPLWVNSAASHQREPATHVRFAPKADK